MCNNKTSFLFFLISALSIVTFAQEAIVEEVKWYTNFEEAKLIAKKTSKPILLRFQGSDWCVNCWRLDSTLFETKQFESFVDNKFVLVAIDFPAKPQNKLPKNIELINKKLLNKYNPNGAFPALKVLNSNGDLIGEMSVKPNQTDSYIDELRSIILKTKQ
ncbi:thioredoxin family protein [Psychroserpens algicola]|uniref:Thioredoxin family protein n=1 Tax=Psychroserpens algicola TaxID=1719034 RepID=A0ABT0H7G3_9FLAO|nr:thioredoxin family protein [Psychroserpens algicola]MCK8479770.1 thioredoxin family protein [Psychroserpens algicola]